MVKKNIPKSTQKTVTIDQGLWDELDSWISSNQAKKLGFHSKAQFATEAVREKLERYTEGRNVEKEILDRIDNLRMELAKYASIDGKIKLLDKFRSEEIQTKNPELYNAYSKYVEDALEHLPNFDISKVPRPPKTIKKASG